jgi:hypothetical protein
MKAFLVAGILASASPCIAQEKPRIAVFGFDLVNTSPAPTTPEEMARLQRLDAELRDALAASGRYTVVNTGPVQERLASGPAIRGCNGCELAYGRELDASLIAFGWVQKVSNLILNINLVIEDATGRKLHADSVDIRGNTDESWDRGLRWLLRERVLQ